MANHKKRGARRVLARAPLFMTSNRTYTVPVNFYNEGQGGVCQGLII